MHTKIQKLINLHVIETLREYFDHLCNKNLTKLFIPMPHSSFLKLGMLSEYASPSLSRTLQAPTSQHSTPPTMRRLAPIASTEAPLFDYRQSDDAIWKYFFTIFVFKYFISSYLSMLRLTLIIYASINRSIS